MSDTPNAPAKQVEEVDKPLPGIGAITLVIAWLEALITTISAPLLTFVAVLTVASAFQGGKLINDSPTLTQAYSWSLGIGIEGQLAAMAYNARKAAVNSKAATAFFYWLVTLVLYLIGVLTGGIIAYQQANQVSFDQALKAVGVPTFLWDWGRVVVMFGLIVLAAATRYVQPAPQLSTEAELAKIDREARIAAAKQAAIAQRVRGMGAIARGGIAGVTGRPMAEETPALAQGDTQATQEAITQEMPVLTWQEPKALTGTKVAGKHWNAAAYQDYIHGRYGVDISPAMALNTVREVGRDARASGLAGLPYIAPIAALKRKAKSVYDPAQAPVIAQGIPADLGGVFPE